MTSTPTRSSLGRSRDEREKPMANINRVVLVGNLTRDPELRHTPSGMAVCSLRIAVNTRRKDGATGQWTEKPNYFDITVWGAQGENCAQYLAKGRPVGIDGRLEWREWDAQDGTKRQAVEVIADTVQFLGGRGEAGESGGNQFVPAGASGSTGADADFTSTDDDIPF
jgi:single-strand DNA-binding protein